MGRISKAKNQTTKNNEKPKKTIGKTKNNKEPSKRTLFANYTEDHVKEALTKIRNGMKILQASKLYNIPRTTLRNKLQGRAPETSGRVGPECVLGHRIEQKLEDWILETCRMGFPVNKDCLKFSVKQLVEAEKLTNAFQNNLPGRKWFEGFMRRHPRVAHKKSEHLCKARAILTEHRIRLWFADIAAQLKDKIEIFQDPRRIFNMDETAVHLSPSGGLVLAEKGKAAYDVASNDKENVTTLFTVNAAGDFAPPLTLYKYERLPRICIELAPKQWGIGKSENGWMTSEAFYEYFTNVFQPFVEKSGIPLPIVVFLDGHVSHLSIDLSSFCREKQIEICCFPAHATHILQPLDVAVFFPLKKKWKTLVRNWRIKNEGGDVQKHHVPALLSELIKTDDFIDTIKNGFRTCGLYPFDENAVNYSKCVQENVQSNEASQLSKKVSEVHFRDMSHREYIEKKIPPESLRQFKNAKEAGIQWEVDDKYAALYEVWTSAVEDELKQEENASPDTHGKTTLQTPIMPEALPGLVAIPSSDVLEFDFPDFDISLSPNCDTSSKSLESAGVINTNNSSIVHCVVVPNNNSVEEESIDNPELITAEKNESLAEIISVRRNSVDEVLNEILVWPKKQVTNKRKRQVAADHLPSVITSEKWLEIMAAKENEKKSKEAEKEIKKRERLSRIEENKKIKAQKLDERMKKKAAKQPVQKKKLNPKTK